ncbi:MAG TPA: tRNA pseudouridine(55) synthase TruB [Geobacteraceae bacterium]
MDGFIVVDKPAGISSHDVVYAVRRISGEKKAGHTGTLDPFATGVLPVALGEATKAIRFLDEAFKEYRAVMRLGETTDTQDATGEVIGRGDWQGVAPEEIERAAAGMTGRISQVPPMFSALKHNGVPLYRLARRGAEIAREAREIEISSLVIDGIDLPEVAFTVRCSRGTYVRTLAHDMGAVLGCGAHLVRLQRTVSGPFTLGGAISLEELARLAKAGGIGNILISPHEALGGLVDMQVNDGGMARVANGIVPQGEDFIALPAVPGARGELVRISRLNRLLAVAELKEGDVASMRLVRVFNANRQEL